MEPLLILARVSLGALLGVGLALLVESRLAARSQAAPRPRRWAGAALCLALVGASLAQYGLPALPLGEDGLRAHERLFWLLPIALLATLTPWRRALLPLAVLIPPVLLRAFDDWSWEPGALLPLLGLAAAFWLLIASGDLVLRRRGGLCATLQLGLLAGFAAGAIGATGSMAYAQWAGALGTAWGLLALVAWRRGGAGRLDGASLMLLVASFALLAARYSELEPWDAGLLLAALPASLLAEDFFERKLAGRLAGWLVLMALLGAVALRVALAWEGDPYAG